MIHLVFLFLADDESTLLVAFQVPYLERNTTAMRYNYMLRSFYPLMLYPEGMEPWEPITGIMMEKLTSFPTVPKLVVTPPWNTYTSKELGEIPESLHVEYEGDEGALGTILEVLSKRWQTLDLISIIKEAQRTIAKNRVNSITNITDNLSTIPRFQLMPE